MLLITQPLSNTRVGHRCVFDITGGVFRASVPVSSGGLSALVTHGEILFTGAGDGVLRKMTGAQPALSGPSAIVVLPSYSTPRWASVYSRVCGNRPQLMPGAQSEYVSTEHRACIKAVSTEHGVGTHHE